MKDLRTVICEAIGEASMCWSETPKGVFDSSRASWIADKIIRAVEDHVDRKAQLEVMIAGHMEAMRPLLDEWSKLAEKGEK